MQKNNALMRNFTLLFLLFVAFAASAQKGKTLNGTVIVRDGSPANIHIVNLVTEVEVVTDAEGRFSLVASEGDMLVLSGHHIDHMRRLIREDDYKDGTITIRISARPIELDEVTVAKGDRKDAVSLGILTKPAKQYTPAERKIFTATSTAIDGLINKITGRTKRLKREALIEKKELLLEQLDGLWPDAFYADLGISPDRIKGFHYLLVENQDFIDALASDNAAQRAYVLLQLADQYNQSNGKP